MTDDDRALCEKAAGLLGWEWVSNYLFRHSEGRWYTSANFYESDPLADLEAAGRVLEAAFGEVGCSKTIHWYAATWSYTIDVFSPLGEMTTKQDENPLRAALQLVVAVKGEEGA